MPHPHHQLIGGPKPQFLLMLDALPEMQHGLQWKMKRHIFYLLSLARQAHPGKASNRWMVSPSGAASPASASETDRIPESASAPCPKLHRCPSGKLQSAPGLRKPSKPPATGAAFALFACAERRDRRHQPAHAVEQCNRRIVASHRQPPVEHHVAIKQAPALRPPADPARRRLPSTRYKTR